MHIVHERVAAAAALQLLGRGQRQAGAGHAERMAERDGAAVGVHVRRVVGEAELAQHREALRGEGFVQFDHVHVGDRQAEPLAAVSRVAGAGPMPMIRGGTPATAAPRMRARGVRPLRFAASSMAMISAAAPSLTPRGVAGGDGAVLADDRLQLGERLEAGQARMLVACRR